MWGTKKEDKEGEKRKDSNTHSLKEEKVVEGGVRRGK